MKVFESLEGAIAAVPGAKVVDICTPPSLHKARIIEALKSRKHVLCEKPFVINPAEAAEIEQAAEESECSVVVMHNWLGHPAILSLKHEIASGSLGEIVAAHCIWVADHTRDRQGIADPHHWVHSLGGGRLEETIPHIIYTLMTLLQDTTLKVQSTEFGKGTSYPWVRADTLAAFLTGERGSATIYMTFAAEHQHVAFTVVGKDHSAEAILDTRVVDRVGIRYTRRDVRAILEKLYWLADGIRRRIAVAVRDSIGRLRPYRREGDIWLMNEFVRSIEQGTPPPVNLAEAVATVRVTRDICDRMGSVPGAQMHGGELPSTIGT